MEAAGRHQADLTVAEAGEEHHVDGAEAVDVVDDHRGDAGRVREVVRVHHLVLARALARHLRAVALDEAAVEVEHVAGVRVDVVHEVCERLK